MSFERRIASLKVRLANLENEAGYLPTLYALRNVFFRKSDSMAVPKGEPIVFINHTTDINRLFNRHDVVEGMLGKPKLVKVQGPVEKLINMNRKVYLSIDDNVNEAKLKQLAKLIKGYPRATFIVLVD